MSSYCHHEPFTRCSLQNKKTEYFTFYIFLSLAVVGGSIQYLQKHLWIHWPGHQCHPPLHFCQGFIVLSLVQSALFTWISFFHMYYFHMVPHDLFLWQCESALFTWFPIFHMYYFHMVPHDVFLWQGESALFKWFPIFHMFCFHMVPHDLSPWRCESALFTWFTIFHMYCFYMVPHDLSPWRCESSLFTWFPILHMYCLHMAWFLMFWLHGDVKSSPGGTWPTSSSKTHHGHHELPPPSITSPVELEFCKINLEHSPWKVYHCLVVLPGLVSWRLLHVLPAAPRHENHSASQCWKLQRWNMTGRLTNSPDQVLDVHVVAQQPQIVAQLTELWDTFGRNLHGGPAVVVLLTPLWKNSASPLTNYVLIII